MRLMKKNRIAQVWLTYVKKVIPADAGTVQQIECRRAFYAGAEAMLSLSMELADRDEEKACKALSEIEQEIVAFAAAVALGKA